MAEPAQRLATYEDLLALGAERTHELLDGAVEQKAAPAPGHGRAQGSVARYVGGPFDFDGDGGDDGGWWILTEVEVLLGRYTVLRPDLAGWRRKNLPRPDAEQPITAPPDWVCEILSPSTENRDRVIKARLYAEAGVAHYWLVSPEARTVEAYELEPSREGAERRWIRLGAWEDGDTARIAPFDAIELEVGRWFLPRDPVAE